MSINCILDCFVVVGGRSSVDGTLRYRDAVRWTFTKNQKSVASRIVASAKRKDFRTSDRLNIVAIEPPAGSGPAGGGND